MWPFKKNPDLNTLDDSKHRWGIAKSRTDSDPMLVRINSSAKDWVKRPSLGTRVEFCIPLTKPDRENLPSPEENDKLNDIEDIICEKIKVVGPSIHVLTITTGLLKEMIFYVRDANRIREVHESIKQEVKSHEVHCKLDPDEKWTKYAAYAKG